MQRNDGGSVTLTRSEARLVRAALFTVEHYMNSVWDETEVSAVSGYSVALFRETRRELDDLRAGADAIDERRDELMVAVARFESLTDERLTTDRPARWLGGLIAEAQAHDVTVSARLRTFAQGRQA